MWKYAVDLRVGDVWTERPQGRATHSYRVMAIKRGLAQLPQFPIAKCGISTR